MFFSDIFSLKTSEIQDNQVIFKLLY